MTNTVFKKFIDEDQHVVKFVGEKADMVAETVLYRYPTYEERTVICCSVQSGCPIGCVFCGTGKKFIRNLTNHEIIEQVDKCFEYILETEPTLKSIDNIKKLQIMFMSMGEPMLNDLETLESIEILNLKYPTAQLLVSTSAPRVSFEGILTLAKKIKQVGLQFSVHASTDEVRNVLIPYKNKYNLSEISQLGTRFYEMTGRNPFFNYCASENLVTDSDANRLFELFSPEIWYATVSVICEKDKDKIDPSANDKQEKMCQDFSNMLVQRGFNVRVFDPAGKDTIGGGCGQLHYVQEWFKQKGNK